MSITVSCVLSFNHPSVEVRYWSNSSSLHI